MKHEYRSPYEIATSDQPDPRSDFEVISDVVDPYLLDVYREAEVFEARDNDMFSRESMMEMLKIAFSRGAEFEKEHPGELKRILIEDVPREVMKARANRQK